MMMQQQPASAAAAAAGHEFINNIVRCSVRKIVENQRNKSGPRLHKNLLIRSVVRRAKEIVEEKEAICLNLHTGDAATAALSAFQQQPTIHQTTTAAAAATEQQQLSSPPLDNTQACGTKPSPAAGNKTSSSRKRVYSHESIAGPADAVEVQCKQLRSSSSCAADQNKITTHPEEGDDEEEEDDDDGEEDTASTETPSSPSLSSSSSSSSSTTSSNNSSGTSTLPAGVYHHPYVLCNVVAGLRDTRPPAMNQSSCVSPVT